MKTRIVNLLEEETDEEKYNYAICECTLTHEGIEVPRIKEGLIEFNCPRCGKELGIYCTHMYDGFSEQKGGQDG